MKIMLHGRFAKRFFMLTAFFATILFLLAGAFLILLRFAPVLEEKASNVAKNEAVNMINKATYSVFYDISTPELSAIDKDENGKIVSITANTVEINRLKTKLAKDIQEYTEDGKISTVYIPIGSLTNFAALQGFGYRIPVKISTDGFANVDFEDEFTSCGINQVLHKLYLTVSVKVSVISFAFSKTETITNKVPVSETVISGTVPNYYGDNMSILGR